jgi:hypothetical protein
LNNINMDPTQRESLKKVASENEINNFKVFISKLELENKYVLRVKILANTAIRSHRLNVYNISSNEYE